MTNFGFGTLGLPQHVGDPRAVGAEGRHEPGGGAKAHGDAEGDRGHEGRHRQPGDVAKDETHEREPRHVADRGLRQSDAHEAADDAERQRFHDDPASSRDRR